MVRGTFATTVPYSKHANVTITGEQLDGRLGVHSLQAMLRKEEARRGPPGPRGARGASQGVPDGAHWGGVATQEVS